MSQSATGTKRWFSAALVFSFLVALVAMLAPQRRMPIDFHMMLWLSLPLAGIWLVTSIVSVFRFHQKALWMLLGAPLALYWPLWLMFNHIPACYWHGNCQ
jgi:hypothetical protein